MGSCLGTVATVDVEHRSVISSSNANISQNSNPSNENPSTSDPSTVQQASAHSQPSISGTWQSSFRNDRIVDPADILSILDERTFRVINNFTAAEILQIQRHVRNTARAIRGMPAASALMNMGRTPTASSLLPNTKTGLSKHCMDEAVLRRIFASGSDHFHRGLTELSKFKKKRNQISTFNASKHEIVAENTAGADINSSYQDNLNRDSPLPQSFLTGKYKADPVGSVYLLLLACTEARWESYAAACVAASAKVVGASASPALDSKKRSFRNGTTETGNPDDVTNNVPSGISFFILCYFLAIVMKSSNRDEKLLLLFHILVPTKQLKSIFFQQQNSYLPKFPSYMFEAGFMSLVDQPYLSGMSEELHPSNLGLKVSSAVTLDTIASLLLTSIYSSEASDGLEFGEGKIDVDNVEMISKLNALYDSFTVDQLLTYDDFIHWAGTVLDDDIIDFILLSLFSTGIFISPERELRLIRECWLKWQRGEYERRKVHEEQTSLNNPSSKTEGVSSKKKSSVIWGLVNGGSLDPPPTNGNDVLVADESDKKVENAWGGIGNFDGLGGLGNGVLYCVDADWWKKWEKYTGWTWESEYVGTSSKTSGKFIPHYLICIFIPSDCSIFFLMLKKWLIVDEGKRRPLRNLRPREIANESLLQKDNELIGGSFGSYEVMKVGLQKNVDYVLVPCPVWDVLFDLYGGGPPLPRMVDGTNIDIDAEKPLWDSSKVSLFPIPESLLVVTHPWIIHCQVRNNILMCAIFFLPEKKTDPSLPRYLSRYAIQFSHIDEATLVH